MCTLLLRLHQKKSSAVSPLLHLLGVKQHPTQSFDDYAQQLRIEAYKNGSPQESPVKKEEFLVTAFVHGLVQQDLSTAISAMKPTTLEEALLLARKEKKTMANNTGEQSGIHALTVGTLRVAQQETLTLQALHEHIVVLQKKIEQLEWQLKPRRNTYTQDARGNNFVSDRNRNNTSFQVPNPTPQRRSPQFQSRQSPLTCYNCGEQGHVARHCPHPLKCYKCGRNDHIARDCARDTRPKRFMRHIQADAEELERESWSTTEDEHLADVNKVTEEDPQMMMLSHEETVRQVSGKGKNWGNRPQNSITSRGFGKIQTAEAEAWTSFIRGDARKPIARAVAHTVISATNSEPARNKPVIMGRCAGEKTKLLIDSGAEMNVMDCDFLNDLLLKQVPVKFTPSNSRIQCANGSKMAVTGYATMTLQVGSARAVQKFMIVKGLFPKVIVGIRSMKTMGIVMDPSSDCVIVDGRARVPFLSRIVPESVKSAPVGNFNGPFMGARKGPQA
jgi:hypothetical protein